MRLTLNGADRDADPATTLLELLDLAGHLPDGHAVAVNDEVVPRSEHRTRRLVDGDRVEVVTAVAGG